MHDLNDPANRRWALAFEVVNACSWSAVLGAPLMLLFKSLGASATVLGVVVALVPLTGALQLYGVRLLPRYGYRGLMLRGWTARTILACVITLLIVLSPRLGQEFAKWGILFLLAGFTVLRGVTSCAWMPWITQLVPLDERGRYLAWATALIQATLIVCGLSYSYVFSVVPGTTGFAVVFGWGCLTGFAASWVMSRIPDVTTDTEGGFGEVPWRAMFFYRPFAILLGFAFLVNVALSALGVLWVPVLRDIHGQGDSLIAFLPVVASAVQLLLMPLLGPLVDRTGSRPLLFMALLVWILHAGLWAGLAGGFLPLSWPVLVAIQGSAGAAGGGLGLASQRLLMATVPAQGRSHFFAMHSVVMAAGQGVAPVLWGMALDRLALRSGCLFNAHALLYVVICLLLSVSMLVCLRLSEARALGTVEFLRELLVRTPRRALARLVSTSG